MQMTGIRSFSENKSWQGRGQGEKSPPEPGHWSCRESGEREGAVSKDQWHLLPLNLAVFPLHTVLRAQRGTKWVSSWPQEKLSVSQRGSPKTQHPNHPEGLVKPADSHALHASPPTPTPPPPHTHTFPGSGAGPRNFPGSEFPGGLRWTVKFENCALEAKLDQADTDEHSLLKDLEENSSGKSHFIAFTTLLSPYLKITWCIFF